MKDEGNVYLPGRNIYKAIVTKMVQYFTALDKNNRTEWRDEKWMTYVGNWHVRGWQDVGTISQQNAKHSTSDSTR